MEIVYTDLKYLDSFWVALDEVARERKYLLFVEGPEIEGTKEFIESIIKNNDAQYFAIEDGKVVGWCDILASPREGLKHVGHVGMGVRKEFREQGLGEILFRHCIDHALNNGITRIELEVFASNERAVALYEKLGFQLEGRKRNARKIDGHYEDFLIMALIKE